MILAILTFSYLGVAPNGNEEHYLQVAKAWADPAWISSPNSLQQFAGNRITYQYIAGYLLSYFSFETTVFLVRLLLISGVTIFLTQLYNLFQFTSIYILLHLLILFLPWQSFFGGSWLLLSAEPKCFAYMLSIGSINLMFLKRYRLALILLIFAAYFHILATLYLLGFGLIAGLLSPNLISRYLLIKGVIIFLIMVFPIMVYTYSATLTSSNSNSDIFPSADWIYTFFRNPHHLAFHYDTPHFFNQHVPGILISILALLFAIKLHPYFSKVPNLQFTSLFVIVSLTGCVLALAFLFFDKDGEWLKYHLFRVNTWSVFWLFFLFTLWIKEGIAPSHNKLAEGLVFTIALFFFSKSAMINVLNHRTYYKEKRELERVCAFIQQNTEKHSVIFSFIDDYRLIRWAERDRFAVFKFVPSDFSTIHEWYERVLEREKVLSAPLNLEHLVSNYSIHYILAKQPLQHAVEQSPIYQRDDIWVYKVNRN